MIFSHPLITIYCYSARLVGTWFLMHALERLIKTKKQHWKRLLLFFCCWYLIGNPILIGDPINILTTAPGFLLILFITCQGSAWKKTAIGILYANTVFSFNALRDNYLNNTSYILTFTEYEEYIRTYQPKIFVISSTASFLFSALLYAGIKKCMPDRDYELADRLWKLIFLLSATPFCIMLSITVFLNTDTAVPYFLPRQSMECLVLITISLLSFVSLFWCIAVLAKQQRLERRNMFAETNRKYYEAMEQQHFEIRRLRHDLANHLQVIAGLPGEQREDYIRKLADHLAAIPTLSYCGDTTVNAVLSVKKTYMERLGIRPELSLDIPSALPFDKTEVCALYANALDNAVEACMKCREGERWIRLKSKVGKGLFCLEISNPLPDAASLTDLAGKEKKQKSGLLPPTSKADAENHGFGLKGIQETVAKYHGSMELKAENGIFDLFLYIPL